MNRVSFGIAVFFLLVSSGASARHVTTVPGYVSHGINVYNDQPIVDYSQASPSVPWLGPDPLIKEIGVLDESSDDAGVINETTDRSRPVATIRSFVDFFNPDGTVDASLFNKPLDAIGSSFFTFSNLGQRAPLVPFADAGGGDLYRSKGTNARPTVGDWEKINGQIRVVCKSNGTAKAKVTIRDAIPNGVYTLWDIGALNPQSDKEEGYGVPFGGLPNIVLTDKTGCGYKEVDLAVCPTRACEPGSESCSSYISAFYHWDSQVYGGSPAASFSGAPVGVVAANQIVWPMSGESLIEPQNQFHPKRPGCRRY